MSGNDPLDPEFLQKIMKMISEGGMPDLGDLAGMLGGAGLGGFPFGAGQGDPWTNAARVAESVAAQAGTDANVDPKVRLAIEDLSRVADMHARQRPGVSLPSSVPVRAMSRREWTTESVTSYRPFFERFIEALQQNGFADLTAGEGLEAFEEDEMSGQMADAVNEMMKNLVPLMVTGTVGSMLGYMGQRVIGSYDLPVPRTAAEIQVVPDGMQEIADATGAPMAEVQMYVMIHELIAHSVLKVPHVAARLDALYMDFASAFRPNPEAIAEELGDLSNLPDLSDPSALSDPSQLAGFMSMGSSLQDPNTLLRMMRSRTHDLLMPQLDALVAAVLGFVEHSTMAACSALMTGHPAIRDAMRARQTAANDAGSFAEKLLGLNITTDTLERGGSFIAGIVERAGDEGLERLWADELDLPTAAEVDAPGLWLERIGFGDSTTPAFEIPDDLSGL